MTKTRNCLEKDNYITRP